MDRKDRIAALARMVGDDGTGDLGVIVDTASPDATTEELAEVVREAREDAALEREHDLELARSDARRGR